MTTPAPPHSLEIGDVMRMSVSLIETLQDREEDLLVRVKGIERQPDGTVKLWLENAEMPPTVWQ